MSENEYPWLAKLMFGDYCIPRFWCDKFFSELPRLNVLQRALGKFVWFVLGEHGNLDGIAGIRVDDVLCATEHEGLPRNAC